MFHPQMVRKSSLCAAIPPGPTGLVAPVRQQQQQQQQQVSAKRETFEQFARKIRRAGLIRHHQIWTHSHGMILYKNAFRGEEFLAWLMCTHDMSRNEALERGQCLMERRLIAETGWIGEWGSSSARTPTSPSPIADATQQQMFANYPGQQQQHFSRSFSSDRYYKLNVEEDCTAALNTIGVDSAGEKELAERRPKVDVRLFNARLCTVLDEIYAVVLSEDKRSVHLDLLDDCAAFAVDYAELSLDANFLDIAGASRQERIALFLNLHNIVLVHITHKFGLPGTIWQKRKYLYSTYYNIGGHLYSLQSIFNGILRGNRRGLGMLWKPFGEMDARNEFLIEGGEPLVHFGLNNYTRSTPPVRTYSTENVYEELRANACACLESGEFLQVDLKAGKVHVAKLFKYYADDFRASAEDILLWIVQVMPESSEKRAQLVKMLVSRSYALTYLPMDFDLNMTYGVNGLAEEQLGNGPDGGGQGKYKLSAKMAEADDDGDEE